MKAAGKFLDLACSGSGVRFPVFIGMLKAIEEAGWIIRKSATNSGSSLVMGLYKSGLSVAEIEDKTLNTDFTQFASFSKAKIAWKIFWHLMWSRWSSKPFGLNDGSKFEEALAEWTDNLTFRDVPGLYMMTTDMCAQKTVVFSQEHTPDYSIARAIRASIAIPIVWNPVIDDGEGLLYDGGLRYNFPIDYFQPEDGVPLIGVRLVDDPSCVSKSPGFMELLDYAIDNLVDAKDKDDIEDAAGDALVIGVRGFGIETNAFDIPREDKLKLIDEGYTTVKKALERLGSDIT